MSKIYLLIMIILILLSIPLYVSKRFSFRLTARLLFLSAIAIAFLSDAFGDINLADYFPVVLISGGVIFMFYKIAEERFCKKEILEKEPQNSFPVLFTWIMSLVSIIIVFFTLFFMVKGYFGLVHRHELIDCFMLNGLHFFLCGVIYGYP